MPNDHMTQPEALPGDPVLVCTGQIKTKNEKGYAEKWERGVVDRVATYLNRPVEEGVYVNIYEYRVKLDRVGKHKQPLFRNVFGYDETNEVCQIRSLPV